MDGIYVVPSHEYCFKCYPFHVFCYVELVFCLECVECIPGFMVTMNKEVLHIKQNKLLKPVLFIERNWKRNYRAGKVGLVNGRIHTQNMSKNIDFSRNCGLHMELFKKVTQAKFLRSTFYPKARKLWHMHNTTKNSVNIVLTR